MRLPTGMTDQDIVTDRLSRLYHVSGKRRTKADIEVLRTVIRDVVLADPPMTVRQAFYQLVVRGVIEKTEVEYQNVVIRLISEMRMNGDLPWDSIVDESRRMRVTQTFDNIQDAIAHTARTYRRSAMKQSDSYLEIWCAVQKRQGRHSPRRH
jgi:hypothetical protein